jgi:hypothetical protein
MKIFAGCIAILLGMLGNTALAEQTAASGVVVAPLMSEQPAVTTTQSATPPQYPPPPQGKAGKPFRNGGPHSKSLDLRRCLDMKNAAAIAKCAGEL